RQSNRHHDIATSSEIALLAGGVFGLYKFRDLNETKVWLIAVIAAGADANEFDLSDDEPVTAAVYEHSKANFDRAMSVTTGPQAESVTLASGVISSAQAISGLPVNVP
ncbi:hypothetical protein LTR72_012578, partial [Exophiala xenobiotica]